MSSVESGVRPVELAEGDVLLDVRDVSVNFKVAKRRVVHAVDHVSFQIAKGSTFGLIGESGSGKSTLARMIVGLVRGEGDVLLDGKQLNRREDRHRGGVRKVQMVVQDPHASLDPRMTVGASVGEPLRVAGLRSRDERRERVIVMMERVGLTADQARRYPHEMSGGQKQRVSIAVISRCGVAG
jgi:ABC-type glutathione transport system ATPase component